MKPNSDYLTERDIISQHDAKYLETERSIMVVNRKWEKHGSNTIGNLLGSSQPIRYMYSIEY